jgi:predicted transcriptional regulator
MDLATWMKTNGIVDQQLADHIKVTRSYVTRIRNGQVHPNLGTALAIWDYTRHEIDIRQLLPRAERATASPSIAQKPPVRKVSRARATA